MAQYWLDFGGDTVGNAPAGLTSRWTTTGLTLAVQSDAAAPSGKSVRVTKTALNRCAVTVNAVDSDSDRGDFEIRALIRTPSVDSSNLTPGPYLLGRGAGAVSSESCYGAGLVFGASSDSKIAEFRKYVSGGLAANFDGNQTSPSAFALNTAYWLRLRVNGTSLTRGLAPIGDPQNETWTVSTTDAQVSAAGWIGFLPAGNCNWDILAVGIGTNGDNAPTQNPSDTTAPTLTGATATATGATTASGSVTTDEANGTLYSVATTSATKPSKAQVKAGQNNSGATAAWAGNQAVSSTGAKSVSVTGLTAEANYYLHHMHEDAAANQSDVESSASFTTTATVAVVKGVTLTLYSGTTPQASITGIRALWWDTTSPSGAPAFSTTSASTDGSGALTLDIDNETSLDVDDPGFLLLYKLDAIDHEASLVFAGRVAVSDIS